MELKEILKKIVLLGDGGVGKTSLITRYVIDKFDDKYIATIGTKVSRKDLQLTYPNLIINLRLMIWDILGQKEYSKIRNLSMSGSHGLLLVTDLCRPETVRSVDEFWIPEAEKVSGKLPLVLVGNKVDACPASSPGAQSLQELGRRLKSPVFFSSAKTGENVEAVFGALGKSLLTEYERRVAPARPEAPETLAEVVDLIIQDFCAQYGDLEKAMLIVTHQFGEAGVDIRRPDPRAILQALEGLAKAEQVALSETVAKVNLDERRRMVETVGR